MLLKSAYDAGINTVNMLLLIPCILFFSRFSPKTQCFSVANTVMMISGIQQMSIQMANQRG